MSNEPALTSGFIVSLVSALILLATEFGLPLTEGQQSAIIGLVVLVAPVAVALITRAQVYGPETVKRIKRQYRGH